ncbi:OLC1v1023327C1 [Oldenlandia corymbosa var. corymbosa]|uniref:NADH kinase n=1 Tax=Oldenlandia corymbosa var. corymbosa TaxID=529605 RepID=A0AAV1C144_OLDCO|nr:OLC1v1023327C1 [Oldenlandia corymbosa var. corymbosa]
MARRRLLLLLKPLDVYPSYQSNGISRFTNPKVVSYLDDRRRVHHNAINFCQNILRKKFVDCETVCRTHLSEPIRDVDLVVTVGGDGTLLQASHFIDDKIPVLGVNSDPTKAEEVVEFSEDFDASRSTGYLCAATVENFENLLDDILENHPTPSEVSRMSIRVNSEQLSTHALNDVLIAHPCPATVSRFSFRIWKEEGKCSPLVSTRSSGFRVSTAAGSTAAMLSAGGFTMPILSRDLQYMVREPISPSAGLELMRGVVKSDESMEIKWFSKEGVIYIDGSHVVFEVNFGDTIELSSRAPSLKVFLPSHLLS